MRIPLLVLCLAAACGGDDASSTDGRPNGSDSGHPDSHPDSAFDAAPPTAGSHTLFLQTEGVTVTPAGHSDANTNMTTIAFQPTELKPYLASDAQRTSKIAAIVADLTAIVAPYDITVTNTRPAPGTYTMIVVTDDSSAGIEGTAGGQFVVELNCSSSGGEASGVAFLFASGSTTGFTVEQQSLAMFGELQKIPGTTKDGDCMNWNGVSFSAACTIGGAGTPASGSPNCAGTPTIDEGAVFLATFGAHP